MDHIKVNETAFAILGSTSMPPMNFKMVKESFDGEKSTSPTETIPVSSPASSPASSLDGIFTTSWLLIFIFVIFIGIMLNYMKLKKDESQVMPI